MDERINELIGKMKNREFIVHNGDIYVSEIKGELSRKDGWWLYEDKLGSERSSSCNMNELSELICLLLNREMERG